MNRLLHLKASLISNQQAPIDPHIFNTAIFGPNYPQRWVAFDFLIKMKVPHFNLTHDSRYQARKQILFKMMQVRKNYNRTFEQTINDPNPLTLFSNGFVSYDYGFCVRAGVHTFLYNKALILLGTEKHQNLIERAFAYDDIGCFGLTQLTHGSNVKGIMTEAHYDHSRKQFILHTPSKEAMKFWIGAAAQTANMAVIWAQLYIGEKCHGVHAYVVPIRDPQTHKLLPGVLIGDCGPKNGVNGIDNGFIILDRVRIPKNNQLDKISGVDDSGNFRTAVANDDKRFGVHLSALSGGRYMIAANCMSMSLQAVVIAVRYCNQRRQFKGAKDTQEKLLIEYPLMKRRLMPLLAQTLVYYTASNQNLVQWDKNQKTLLELTNIMDNKIIDQLHAISSVMKAKTSWFTSDCIRQCRQAMGGHGYSAYSKLGSLYDNNDVNLTWQGDNHVLIQQCTKYVLQQAQKVLQKGKKTSNPLLQFFSNPPDELPPLDRNTFTSLTQSLVFFQYKLMRKIQQTGMRMMQLKQKGLTIMQIWNGSQIYLGRQIAQTYGDISVLTTMMQRINQTSNIVVKSMLQLVTKLWLLSIYRKDELLILKSYPLIQAIMSEYSDVLQKRSLQILKIVSPDDEVIGSPFADPNGKGIQKYLNLILSHPSNTRPENWEWLLDRTTS